MAGDDKDYELGGMNANGRNVFKGPLHVGEDVSSDHDRDELQRLGKRQVLRRNFGFMSILGFSCTVLITWEASLTLFLIGLNNGGSAGLIYGYLLVWAGNFAVFASLSELVSMAPTSGGQYHWVSMLAPPAYSKFLGYLTGWLSVAGWTASIASTCSLTGLLIQGLITLCNPTYVAANWHPMLLFWAVLLFCIVVNTVISSLLPKFEGLILILHIVGFFAVLIPMVRLGTPTDAHTVFTTFNNGGHWPNSGLSFFVGLTGNAFAFLGLDGAYHMSEEIQRPSIIVPRSIMLTLVINGTMGFGIVVAVLFCMGDIEAATQSPTGFPFMHIFLESTKSVGGTAAMASIITALAMCANVGFLASASRVLWAFARDRGIPGHRILSKVEQRTSVPLWAIGALTLISVILSTVWIGSLVAFNIIVSLTVACLYSSYLVAIVLVLWRRCTGGISSPGTASPTTLANTVGTRLVWGPWRFSPAAGITINILACLYLILVLFFSFWPPYTPITPKDMNYSSVLLVAVLLFSVGYYFTFARKAYDGPIVETELVVDGVISSSK